jgi:Flp pilus assembly protein TadD
MSFPRVLTAALLTLFLPVGLSAQKEKQQSPKTKLQKAAQQAWAHQDYAKAADVLAELVKVDENNATVWHRLGYALHCQIK